MSNTGNWQSPNFIPIGTIKDKILRISEASIYQVQINLPSEVRKFLENDKSRSRGENISNILDDVSLSCISASLPGSTFATHEITNDYSGVTERHAYRRSYDDRADFSFLIDSDYKTVEIFEGWMNYISGEGDIYSTRELEGNVSYRFKFPDDYRTDIYITKFERNSVFEKTQVSGNNKIKKFLKYKFIKAFPISINSTPVSYGTNDYLAYTVSFSYTRYLRTVQDATTKFD